MPKKGTQEEDLLDTIQEDPAEPKDPGASAAQVTVAGRGRTVADALNRAGLKRDARDIKGKFNELLRDPMNKIVCQRILPRQVRGADGKMRDCGDVVDYPPPMSMDEVVSSLREEYGGKKWNIRIVNEDGEVIDARNIDVPGEPRVIAKPEDDFEIPSLDEFTAGEGGGEPVDPLDEEIARNEKEAKVLILEKQKAQLKSQVDEVKGHKKNGEVDLQKAIADALAQQEARHKAELSERDRKTEAEAMERRLREDSDRRFGEMKALVESVKAGNPQQGTAMTDLSHKLDLLQQSVDTKVKDALGQYRDLTNQQITAMEKGFDSKFSAIQTTLATMQNHKPENPLKEVVPLITSSLERSTSGYKEMMGPIINFMTAKQQVDAAPANPLEDTLETLGKFNLLGDRKSGDFGSRVVDFAERMAPEVMQFIREEKRAGREVSENTLKNHLKLQTEKISREVQAAAKQEIQQIAAQRGIRGSGQQHALPAPQSGQTVNLQGQAGQSPVGRMSPEEAARYERRAAPIQPSAPAPAPAPQPVQQPVQAAPVQPAAPVVSSAPVVSAPPPPPQQQEEEEVEEEGGEEEGEPLTIEEEIRERVNSVLELLEREMRIRPRQITWPNAAWDDLPGDVLNQIIFANDEEDVYKAVEPHMDRALGDRIWSQIRTDTASKDFIVAGINIIKGWAVELQEKQRQAGVGPAAPAQ